MKNTQNALPQNSLGAIRTVAKLSAKDFRDFKLFLNIIKSNFNDFSLVGGAFRAYSYNRTCIVETGFGFLKDMHFDIINIKSFVRLVSKFDKKNPITVRTVETGDQTGIKIADYLVDLQRLHPTHPFIDNKFVSDKDMEETVLKNMDPNRLIVNDAISKKYVCRIKRVSQKLAADHICFKHDKNNLSKAFLAMSGKAKDSPEFEYILQKPLLIPMKKNHYFNLDILPMSFNKDDMYLKCYLTKEQTITAMYSTKVNDLFVNMYTQSELLK
jgi:hypothetical protein